MMLVKVGAARREGSNSVTIYDKPISEAHVEATSERGMQISFVASGIYGPDRQNARYRYTVVLSPDELTLLKVTN